MLKKMLVQGLAAALIVGAAAVVYAQVQDNGYLSTPAGAKAVESARGKDVHKGDDHGRKSAEHERSRSSDRADAGDDD